MRLLLPRTTAGIAALLLVASACTADPEIIEAAPNTAPPETTVDLPVDAAPPELPVTTTEPTAPSTEPVLEDAVAIGIASEFIDKLRSGHASGDLSAAAVMWSGYPSLESERSTHLRALTTVHPWLLEGELSFEAFESWAFEPQWAMKIVLISNAERTAVATLLLDRTGVIQRIDRWAMNEPLLPVVEADTVTFYGIPVEGYALAYLDGVQLGEPVVDHESLTTTFTLPPPTGQPQIIVASFATPEFPSARADIITRP